MKLSITSMGLLLIALKLTGQITWPWMMVTCPFWIPVAGLATAACGLLIAYLAVEAYDYIRGKFK